VGDHYQASEASVTPDPLSRRDFLRSGALAGAAVSVGPRHGGHRERRAQHRDEAQDEVLLLHAC